MSPLLIAGLAAAILAVVVGGVLMIVAAFRAHVLWGLGYLFVPFVSLVFIAKYWKVARLGVLISTIGSLLLLGLALAAPEVRAAVSNRYSGLAAMAPEKTKDLTAEIQSTRDRIERSEARLAQAGPELEKVFRELAAKRWQLKAGDSAAINQFNLDAAAYQTRNTEMKQVHQEILTAKQGLENLLAERSRDVAKAAVREKKIVMFTTSTCPACKMAKQYLAQKSVTYQELDVERSRPAMEEFQRLGGKVVPLLMVSDKRVEGFSPQAFDALL